MSHDGACRGSAPARPQRKAARDAQHRQGDDERVGQAALHVDDAVDGPHEQPGDQHRDEDHGPRGDAAVDERPDHGRERERGSDRQVDPPSDDHQQLSERQHRDHQVASRRSRGCGSSRPAWSGRSPRSAAGGSAPARREAPGGWSGADDRGRSRATWSSSAVRSCSIADAIVTARATRSASCSRLERWRT